MKIIKIKKNEYSNLEALLERAGLVNKETKQAHPENIFVNQITYNKIRKEIAAAYRKEYAYISKKALMYSVEAYLLNLGPVIVDSTSGGRLIPNGVAVVLNSP
jgi:hypothetical protein